MIEVFHLLLYEAGEALRFNETAIRIWLKWHFKGDANFKYVASCKSKVRHSHSAVARSSLWVRAPHSGILCPYKSVREKNLKKAKY